MTDPKGLHPHEGQPAGVQVVWFKRDLRLADHAPFSMAVQSGAVLPVCIIEPDYWVQPDTSHRQWVFFSSSLNDLARSLSALGGGIWVMVGDAVAMLERVRQLHPCMTLWSHEETGNAWTYARDRRVIQWCRDHHITWLEAPSNGVVRRLGHANQWGSIRAQRMAAPPLPIPDGSIEWATRLDSDVYRGGYGWQVAGERTQEGGRKAGLSLLQSFINGRGQRYLAHLATPHGASSHCSRLSPHIAWGTLSVREIEQAVMAACESTPISESTGRSMAAFLSRLSWRCHFVQKLERNPSIETDCVHPLFESLRPRQPNETYFEAWQAGKTGYPLVDACMRALRQTGWLTFRMRAMLMSFASYHLWLDWRVTGPLLARLFTDYEAGIHWYQCQMQSGVTGINAIRMYDPIKQSKVNDPQGTFIRQYLPELKNVPLAYLHEPWRWDGADYPSPIVGHSTAIRAARDAISACRHDPDFKPHQQAIVSQLATRKRKRPGPMVIPEQAQLPFGDFL